MKQLRTLTTTELFWLYMRCIQVAWAEGKVDLLAAPLSDQTRNLPQPE